MGKTPHSGGEFCDFIISSMKIEQKLNLMSGSFITAAYPAWLARLARRLVRSSRKARAGVLRAFNFFRERLTGMRQPKALVDRLKLGLAIAMLTALTGCLGVVGDGGGYYGGGGWWEDDGGWWGGGYGHDRGHDVHGFSARGAASRGAAHGGGGGGHGGGGGGGGGHGGGGGGKR